MCTHHIILEYTESTKITSTSCSSTQEISQDLNKPSKVAANGTQPTLCLLCLSERLVDVQKLLLKAILLRLHCSLPMPHCTTVSPVWIISLIWNLGKLLCSHTNTCTVYHLQSWISPTLPSTIMPHCNTTAPAMELWEAIVKWLKACFAIVHVKGWISPVLKWWWQLVFSLYDLPMRDRLHDSTS